MFAGQQAANQNELNSNLLKSQLAAAVHSRSQSLSGLQPVSYRFFFVLLLFFFGKNQAKKYLWGHRKKM